jgi:hypothetical protein
MTGDPLTTLRKMKRASEQGRRLTRDSVMERKYDAEIAALAAVEQLVQAARNHESWQPHTQRVLNAMHPQQRDVLTALREALAPFGPKQDVT